MPNNFSAVAAKALEFILRGTNSEAQAELILLDYRHKGTFSALWLHGLESGKIEIGEDRIDLTDSTKEILIIGNDPPDGIFGTKVPALAGINFGSHFTATSWLTAWKVRSPESKVTIAIIDPRESRFVQGTARALQTILGAKDKNGLSLVPGVAVLNSPRLTEICHWLSAAKNDTRTLANDAPHLLSLLKTTIWNELTSTSERHHAISNVLGPMILSGKPEPDPPKLDHVTLLRRLLSVCDLVSWEDKSTHASEPNSVRVGADAQPTENGEDLRILLLDDQARQGWEDWVKECLPLGAGSMQVAVDPNALVDALRRALSDEHGKLIHKDARFRLELPGLDGATRPSLLLDLRLFSGNEKAEGEFLKNKLLPLVNHFTDKADLAWPGFKSADPRFEQAKAAVESGTLKTDTEEHHETLTWLPRVVALADMSLPIILFSSTGRRNLIEPFKPYANIITSFEKPRLNDLAISGDSSHVRGACGLALREAASRARQIVSMREKSLAIRELAKSASSFEAKSRESIYVELYLDEDDRATDSEFGVGGVFAVFASLKMADRFEDLCVESGLRFFQDSLFKPDAAALGKYDDSGLQQLDSAIARFKQQGGCVELGFVRLCRGNNASPGQPLNDNEEDSRFWRLTEGVIEMFCAEVLPALKNSFAASKVAYSIYAGTRMVPFGNQGKGDFSYKGNREIHWFREGNQWNGMLRSMSGSDVLPMVTKYCRLHRLDPRFYQLKRAIALALPYKDGPKRPLDRVIHRPTREIFRFDSTRNVELPPLQLPTQDCYGRVTRKPSNRDFLFVEVHGLDRDVFCHQNVCRNVFDDLEPEDSVCLDVEETWSDAKGEMVFRATRVDFATEQDLNDWLISKSPEPSKSFLGNRQVEDFRPDYRALHYLCDQAMRNPALFSEQILQSGLAGQFDEDFTEAFEQALVSSRLLDCQEIGGAFKSFSVTSSQARDPVCPSARSLIARRLWKDLRECGGAKAFSLLQANVLPAPEATRPI